MEKLFRKAVVHALKPLHAVSIENGCGVGTPDVNCTKGWLELKEVKSWPKKWDTPLRIPHFSQEQRVWLARRANAGGNCWVLLKVGKDYLLLEPKHAILFLGYAIRQTLVDLASWKSLGSFDEAGLLQYLTAQ